MSAALQDAVALAEDFCGEHSARQTLAEATLESAISVTCAELVLAISDAEQREIFARLQDLHRQRTPAQVMRLERARGLHT